jgi:NADH-quinone oxidoreductase subunit M
MVQKTFFGKANVLAEQAKKLSAGQGIVLFVLVIAILFLGIYPEPVIHLTQSTVTDILSRMSLK